MEFNHTDLAMEELHVAASAYYQHFSREIQQQAQNVFSSMDINGDGLISCCEFVEFTSQSEYRWIDPNLFQRLDRNGDGSLDFWEFLTLYYIMRTRGVTCYRCRVCLLGLYFTCVKCFDEGYNTYDLCGACYRDGNFVHQHPNTSFLDSYLLLRSRRGLSPGAANPNLAFVPPPPPPYAPPMALVPPPPPPYAPPMVLVPPPPPPYVSPYAPPMALVSPPPPPYAPPMAIVPQQQLSNVLQREKWLVLLQALGTAINVGSVLSSCAIM